MWCDVCVNNPLACRNSELLAAYVAADWRVRPLACAVKVIDKSDENANLSINLSIN